MCSRLESGFGRRIGPGTIVAAVCSVLISLPVCSAPLLEEHFDAGALQGWEFESSSGADRAKVLYREDGELVLDAPGGRAAAWYKPSAEWEAYRLQATIRISETGSGWAWAGVRFKETEEGPDLAYRYSPSHRQIRGFGRKLRGVFLKPGDLHTLELVKTRDWIAASVNGHFALSRALDDPSPRMLGVSARRTRMSLQSIRVLPLDGEPLAIRIGFDAKGTRGPSWPAVCGPHHADLSSPYPPGKEWRYFLRSWPHHTFGPDMDVTDRVDREKRATLSVTGPFSGKQRWYDFTVPSQTSDNTLAELRKGHELGYETSPGFGEVWVPEIRKDKARVQDMFYWAARYFSENEVGGKPVLYWRFGLEMNGPQQNKPYLAMPDIDWDDHGRWHMHNSPRVAHNYVRWLLAPGAEAVERASRDVYGDPDKISVALGTVANLDNPGSVSFVNAILNKKLTSEDAPTFDGDRMWEHVDFVSANFFVDEWPWKDRLDYLYSRYMQAGRIDGIWVTELGRGGNGAWNVLKSAPRFLHWASGRYERADSLRMFFWGEGINHPSGPATLAIEMLGATLQNGDLTAYGDHIAITPEPAAAVKPEIYAFSARLPDGTRGYLVTISTSAPLRIATILLAGVADQAATKSVSVRYWPENSRPIEVKTATVIARATGLSISLQRTVPAGTHVTITLRK